MGRHLKRSVRLRLRLSGAIESDWFQEPEDCRNGHGLCKSRQTRLADKIV